MKESTAPKSAVDRAVEFGIDISLLIENLRLTPTERLLRAQQALESILALREEAVRARSKIDDRP